jgi:hypothetical protein
MTPYRQQAERPAPIPWRVTRWAKWGVRFRRRAPEVTWGHVGVFLGLLVAAATAHFIGQTFTAALASVTATVVGVFMLDFWRKPWANRRARREKM